MGLRKATSSRGAVITSLILLAILINGPAIWTLWSEWRLTKAGVETTAQVTETESLPADVPPAEAERFFISFRLPEEADPKQREFDAEVTAEVWNYADGAGEVQVTYLKDSPSANRVEGQITGTLMLWLVAVTDLVLLFFAGMAWKFAPKPEKELVLLATADLARAKPGYSVTQEGEEHVVRGDVLRMEDGKVVLHVGNDVEVTIVLGEYANPVGYQQAAEARGRVLED